MITQRSSIVARYAAALSRDCREWARTHEDLNVPEGVGATPPAAGGGQPVEPDDYMCCECGAWTPSYTPLEGITDPWGYEIKWSTVRNARDWLDLHSPDWPWAWHPVDIDVRGDMERVVASWPGNVCGACWHRSGLTERSKAGHERGRGPRAARGSLM